MNAKKTLLLLSSVAFLLGCGGPGESSQSAEVVSVPVYLDLFEDYAFALEGVSIEDPSLLTYEDGVFSAKDKAGETKATGTVDGVAYELLFGISASGVLPCLRLDHSAVSLELGGTFVVSPSITYNGKDVLSYADVSFSKEEETSYSVMKALGDKTFEITGNGLGTEHYSIHTSFLGHTLSKPVSVTVVDNCLSVIGRTASYDNDGAYLSLSMLNAKTDPLRLDAIEVVYQGSTLATSLLSFEILNPEYATIEGGAILPKKTGTATMRISYGDLSTTVRLVIFKPVIDHKTVELVDKDVCLDLPVTLTATGRDYSPSAGVYSLPIDTEHGAYVSAGSLSVDGEPLSVEGAAFQFSDDEVKIPLSVFGTSLSGEHDVELVLETDVASVSYSFSCVFVTKELHSAQDIRDYVTQRSATERVLGYYTLGNDVDFGGAYTPGSWTTSGWDFSNGFRGVFDGRGHAISNMVTAGYGFSGIIGMGALWKDTRFENVHYDSWTNTGTALLCRGSRYATYSNLSVTLASDSTPDHGTPGATSALGLFGTDDFANCAFDAIRVSAKGMKLLSLFGKQAPGATFRNVEVVCDSLQYIYGNNETVAGVSVIKG